MDILAESWLLECVPPDEVMLRLCFEPEHLKNGKPIPTMISLKDLGARGYSLDREEVADRSVILGRAEEQAAKMPKDRDVAHIIRFQSKGVCDLIAEDGNKAVAVYCSPIPSNPSHAHLITTVKRSESALRAIRAMIVNGHFQNVISLTAYASSRQWALEK